MPRELTAADEARLAEACEIPFHDWLAMSKKDRIPLLEVAVYKGLARKLLGRALDNDPSHIVEKYPPRKAGT